MAGMATITIIRPCHRLLFVAVPRHYSTRPGLDAATVSIDTYPPSSFAVSPASFQWCPLPLLLTSTISDQYVCPYRPSPSLQPGPNSQAAAEAKQFMDWSAEEDDKGLKKTIGPARLWCHALTRYARVGLTKTMLIMPQILIRYVGA